jgi:hypothetical protein
MLANGVYALILRVWMVSGLLMLLLALALLRRILLALRTLLLMVLVMLLLEALMLLVLLMVLPTGGVLECHLRIVYLVCRVRGNVSAIIFKFGARLLSVLSEMRRRRDGTVRRGIGRLGGMSSAGCVASLVKPRVNQAQLRRRGSGHILSFAFVCSDTNGNGLVSVMDDVDEYVAWRRWR